METPLSSLWNFSGITANQSLIPPFGALFHPVLCGQCRHSSLGGSHVCVFPGPCWEVALTTAPPPLLGRSGTRGSWEGLANPRARVEEVVLDAEGIGVQGASVLERDQGSQAGVRVEAAVPSERPQGEAPPPAPGRAPSTHASTLPCTVPPALTGSWEGDKGREGLCDSGLCAAESQKG